MNKLILFGIIIALAFFALNRTEKMPNEVLSYYSQDETDPETASVGGRCMREKCLTVYVAPWCPACAQLKPTIISLAEQLSAEGVGVKVIVGKDSMKATTDYAKKYPFPVLLDPTGKFYTKANQRGVPFFLVSNRKGKVINQLSGGAQDVSRMRKELGL